MKSKRFALLALVLALLGAIKVPAAAIAEFQGGIALEGGGPAIVHALRSGDTSLAFSVGYSLSDGTAKAGVDYQPQSGTFSFAAGEMDKTFSIPNPSIDNGTVDGKRTILITLTNATGGVSLSTTQANLFLYDNEIPNNLDRSFRMTGVDYPMLLGVQPDGKALVAGARGGASNSSVGVWRLLRDGAIDLSFRSSFSDQNFPASATSVQSDGKCFVAWNPIDGWPSRSRLVRLNDDGSFDPAFSLNSTVFTNGLVGPLRLQTNGQLLVRIASSIVRLNADGSVDADFTPIYWANEVKALESLTDGKILVAGLNLTGDLPVLARYHTNGLGDSSFHSPLFEKNPNPGGYSAVLDRVFVQPDRRILVGGAFDSVNGIRRQNLVRLLPDGAVDESFNPAVDLTLALLLPDGHLLGYKDSGLSLGIPWPDDQWELLYVHSVLELARLRPDGSLDRVFPLRKDVGGILSLLPDGQLLMGLRLNLGDSRTLVRLNLADTDKPGVEFPTALFDLTRIRPLEVSESEAAATNTVRRLGATSNSLSVSFRTRDGTAKAGADYVAPDTSVIFAPLETSKAVLVPILDDAFVEPDEEFELELDDPTGQGTSSPPVLVTIIDDEPAFRSISRNGAWAYLELRAPPSERWRVEASSDLIHWSSDENLYGPIGPLQVQGCEGAACITRYWTDAKAGQYPFRFYRAVKE